MEKYIEFLHKKLFLIECFARNKVIKGNTDFKELLNLCMESSVQIEERYKNNVFDH